VAAINPSFDSNFSPASDFLSLETKRSRTGPHLENRVDGAAVRSLIPRLHDDGGYVSRCDVMVEKHFFLANNAAVFYANRSNNST